MSEPSEEERAGIEALRRRDIEASLRLDGEALASLWTEDGVALAPGKPPTRGRAAMHERLAAVTATRKVREVLEYREEFEETLVFGDTAVEWGCISGSERDRKTGAVTASRFHVMRILRRQPDGSWRVHRSIFASAG
jgi:uncharacterized protein (TIGR02246 family)